MARAREDDRQASPAPLDGRADERATAALALTRAVTFGVTLPAWGVYMLGGLLIAIGLATPWLARWQGCLHEAAPDAESSARPRDLRPVLIELPAGAFWMGSPESEPGRSGDEGPRHRVRISRPFEMCQTEVTQGQYEAVMGTNPSDCDYGCGDDLPVQNVSWLDAIAYLDALSDREGLSRCHAREGDRVTRVRPCEGYRLPTEAEWEYAARARSQTAYSFDDDPAQLDRYAWFPDNAGGEVHPVAKKAPNAWFLHDMHGNVWEWVWDWMGLYAPDPGDAAAVQTDPEGPPENEAAYFDYVDKKWVPGKARVLRGGSFVIPAEVLRSADRNGNGPENSFRLVGFRCARGGAPSIDP